jgi:hypothetical protein
VVTKYLDRHSFFLAAKAVVAIAAVAVLSVGIISKGGTGDGKGIRDICFFSSL